MSPITPTENKHHCRAAGQCQLDLHAVVRELTTKHTAVVVIIINMIKYEVNVCLYFAFTYDNNAVTASSTPHCQWECFLLF